MRKVKNIKKEDLIELGFKKINNHRYEYVCEGNRVFEANIHDFTVDTFFVLFFIGKLDIHIEHKDDLKKLIDVTTKNIIQSWMV
jgi:hypothetical protein